MPWNKNGDPVVSAVHMKAVRSRLEINKVASVYGTENGKKLKSMEMTGLTLYRREKLSRDNSAQRAPIAQRGTFLSRLC
ncbi:hypothetical protein [Escherichia coli]|uniref:MuF-C-terminal domain-containing protein n=1 Tax=Escherichia coli TaxID=562 RepID=UPI0030F43F78